MDHETNYQTNHQFRRLPKGERRVRFADSMGMELVSIFLFDLINNYYFASIHNHHQLPPPKTIPKQPPSLVPPRPITRQASAESPEPNPAMKQYQSLKTSPTITNSSPPKPTILSRTTLSAASAILTNKLNGTNQINSYHNNNSNQHLSNKSPVLLSPANQSQNNSATNKYHDHYHSNHHQQQSNVTANNQVASFVCEFTQPISLISFMERVKLNKILLETCSVNSVAGNTSISCTIRVLNQSYDKSVIVRYTTDEWHTHTDSLASYKPGSCDGRSDKFTSTFSVTNQVKQFRTGQRIMFAVRITYDGDKVHWDNNGGLNYTIKKV